MAVYLLDTTTLTLLQRNHPKPDQFGQATANTHYPLWRPGFTGGRTYLLAAGIRF